MAAKGSKGRSSAAGSNGSGAAQVTAVPGSQRVPLEGARALGPVNPHAPIEVTVKVRRKQPLPELDGRPKHVMTREELADKYGASREDLDRVARALAKHGLTPVDSSELSRTVRFSGAAGAMEQAFATKLFNYAHAGGNYRGRVGSVHVPAEVQDVVEGVFGLDNRRVARRRRLPPHVSTDRQHVGTVPSTWYKPADLAKHYNFPPGDGAGQTLGVLEFGGGYFESDLKHFCTLTHTAVPVVRTVSVDGTSVSARDGAEGEVMLDVEVIAGVCPKSTIVAYFAEWTEQGWIAALDAVIADKQHAPSVISISWGAPEDTDIWTRQAMREVNQTLLEAAHLGITVCVAAGDDGSSDADDDGLAHADFPASSPYVIAVGGTTITKHGSSKSDIVWFEGDGLRSDNGGSTGGGVSAVTPRPTWQSKINIASVNPGAIAGRVIPDLSANADWNASPYLLVVDGQPQPNGGTSAAAPLVAALVARLNALRPAGKPKLGYLTPVLYQGAGAAGCTDVTTGNNDTAHAGGYAAGPGYDAASGWGVPDGQKLAAAVKGL